MRTKAADATIGEYRAILHELRVGNATVMVANEESERASALIQELLRAGKDWDADIDLLTGGLVPKVYDGLRKDLEAYLQPTRWRKQRQMRILMETVPTSQGENRIFDYLRDRNAPGVELAQLASADHFIDPEATPIDAPGNRTPHFMVVGWRAYRFELDHDTFTAEGCFNDEDRVVVSALKIRFETLWKRREPFEIRA